MNQAKKDFQSVQQEADSVAMKINQAKEDLQNQVLPGEAILIDLKDQQEASLIVMKTNRAKEVSQNQVSEKVDQIDSREKVLKDQREVDSVAMKINQVREVFLSQLSERVETQIVFQNSRRMKRNHLKRKNLRETRNPSLKKERGQKILVSHTNRGKGKNLLMDQSKSINEKISIQVLKKKNLI